MRRQQHIERRPHGGAETGGGAGDQGEGGHATMVTGATLGGNAGAPMLPA
jgi:hypothetical protein